MFLSKTINGLTKTIHALSQIIHDLSKRIYVLSNAIHVFIKGHGKAMLTVIGCVVAVLMFGVIVIVAAKLHNKRHKRHGTTFFSIITCTLCKRK